jgi:anaerobic sulfite reductase subunit A
VDQQLLDQLVKTNLSPEIEGSEIRDGYWMLKGFLGNMAESTLTDLAVEYASIFLGVRGKDSAFPYESVYTSSERKVMQEARDQVLKIYREEGLCRAEDFYEPEDHIALELEYMAYLCRKQAEALRINDKWAAIGNLNKQKDFLEKHLMIWVPTFCTDIQRIAQADFYKAIAKITTGYIDMEQDLIGELIVEIKSILNI